VGHVEFAGRRAVFSPRHDECAVITAPNGDIFIADGHGVMQGHQTNDRIVKHSKDVGRPAAGYRRVRRVSAPGTGTGD
jgi:hypothetical protein